jgi:phage gpG-like protein
MTPPEYFRNLQNQLQGLEQQILRDIIEVEAEAFHAMNFRNEGFTDVGVQPWQPRKPTKADAGKGKRALLVKTGAMKRHATKGNVRGKQVDFDFPLAYMRVHNEGGKAGRGAGFTMPKRQYVGPSAYLEARIQQKVLALMKQKFGG